MNTTVTRVAKASMLLSAGLAFALCLRAEAQSKTPPGTTPASGQPQTPAGTPPPAGGQSTTPGTTPAGGQPTTPAGGKSTTPGTAPAGSQPTTPGTTPAGGPSTINKSPFFGTPDVRQHLNLTNGQYQGMNQAYQNAWSTYQKGINNIDPNWSAMKRQQAMQDLQQGFYKNFSDGSTKFLTDPAQRQRVDQLFWQYRGYGAFADPTIASKLNLTPDQRAKLDQAYLNWSNQMSKVGPMYNTNQDQAAQQFKTMQTQRFGQIQSILTPEQRRVWEQMSGKPYTFSPSSYYTPATPAPTTGK